MAQRSPKAPPPPPEAPSPFALDRKALRALLRTLERGGVTEFEYEDERVRVRIGRGRAPGPAAPAYAAEAAAPAAPPPRLLSPGEGAAPVDDDVAFITSPFVGTFYRSPSPDAAPFVQVGSVVKQGQALCIIEAMKLMNEIENDVPCTILDILVENGKPVEFGQRLFKVRKA
ncbi:MAG TPA: acetyl-CoA carboxylase biotin carboxyl carrier protein [Polyangiaceae bacterium]|nr:acetyl-CoA carboxylase biotin carboxyl carrier protein [Polyangiaceae bacterium]